MIILDANNSFFFSLLDSLKKWDTALFLKINNDWTNSFLNDVFPWWRDAGTWVPLYLFLAIFIFLNFGWKAWPWVLFVALTATITDQISSGILKDWINRPRPCNDVLLQPYVHLLLNRCPQSGSFTSSHAANHFGSATFFYFTLKPYFKKWSYLFFLWAATISYGQVYVGVHYPLDIIGGAILGFIIGRITVLFFTSKIGLPALINKSQEQ